MSEFLEELWDEFTDFFEDFFEHAFRKPKKAKQTRTILSGGVEVKVRPAYIFAERVDNVIKIIFGLSIAISAFTVTFFGFASLADLVDMLIATLWGRVFMFVIGTSYVIIAAWKLFHIHDSTH